MRRFLRNLRWFLYFLTRYGKVISMSLTAAQLQTLETDMNNVITAAQADGTAQANLAAAQTALATAQTAAAQTGPALAAAGAQLLADAQADFPPATS